MEMTMAVIVFKVAKVVAVESTWTPAKALWCAVVDAYIVNQRFADLTGDIRCRIRRKSLAGTCRALSGTPRGQRGFLYRGIIHNLNILEEVGRDTPGKRARMPKLDYPHIRKNKIRFPRDRMVPIKSPRNHGHAT